jgi:hypothetical protein
MGARTLRLIVRFTYSFMRFSADAISDRTSRTNRRVPSVQKQTYQPSENPIAYRCMERVNPYASANQKVNQPLPCQRSVSWGQQAWDRASPNHQKSSIIQKMKTKPPNDRDRREVSWVRRVSRRSLRRLMPPLPAPNRPESPRRNWPNEWRGSARGIRGRSEVRYVVPPAFSLVNAWPIFGFYWQNFRLGEWSRPIASCFV